MSIKELHITEFFIKKLLLLIIGLVIVNTVLAENYS